jgi:hypothetical protein
MIQKLARELTALDSEPALSLDPHSGIVERRAEATGYPLRTSYTAYPSAGGRLVR